jgi:hypothetical protein
LKLKGCKLRIINPNRRYYNKINANKPMFPYSYICYLGDIELIFKTNDKQKAHKKLQYLIQITSIGRFSTEGMGKVQWLNGSVSEEINTTKKYFCRKLKIRKGLPHYLPDHVQKLLRYALLHDFAHTSKHKSKIYVEIDVPDIEYLRKHHDHTNDRLIQVFKYYDQLAAKITRKIHSPRTNRYKWSATKSINFEQLAKELEEVSTNLWKLYEYIYESEKLDQLNESLQHGHSSLKTHLLTIGNLIVQDYQKGNL